MALPRGAAPAQLPPAPLTVPDQGRQPSDLLGQPQLLRKELDSFVRRLRPFTPARWAAGAPVLGTRADVVRHLAQALADASSLVEDEPERCLPVLQPDLLVVDQLAVTGDDLLRAVETAGPAGSLDPVVGAAVGHLLLHRWHVLGDEPPVSLGGADVLRHGSSVCAGN